MCNAPEMETFLFTKNAERGGVRLTYCLRELPVWVKRETCIHFYGDVDCGPDGFVSAGFHMIKSQLACSRRKQSREGYLVVLSKYSSNNTPLHPRVQNRKFMPLPRIRRVVGRWQICTSSTSILSRYGTYCTCKINY
jgi:hypothetical protein